MEDHFEKFEREAKVLYAAIGQCIVAWAQVEFQLAYLWRKITGTRDVTADLLWNRVRSFDAKLQSASDLIASTAGDQQRADWILLNSYIASQYSKRNQVAHATMIDKGNVPLLEPFFSLSKPNSNTLNAEYLERFTVDFSELTAAIVWFEFAVEASPHSKYLEQAPDLIQRLRKTDAQKREAQRHRALAWRQYLQSNPDLKLD